MIALLAHRGPDDSGTFTDDGIGLANARLKIVDLEGGHQPMCGEGGEVWVTFNGEIFNFQAERTDLETRGHDFKTDCDTEVIVHLYEEFGPSFVNRLNGMFAFALWDSRSRQLYLARDYAGMKPLYYTIREETLYFASEIKSLLFGSPRVCESALNDFLLLGYVPDQHTLFDSVSKLRPGQILRADRDGIAIWNYGEPLSHASSQDGADLKTNLRIRLERASKDWLMSDVPVGALISGGVDSSLITAFAVQQSEKKIRTYTAWFGPGYPNELAGARITAEWMSTDHSEVLVEESDVIRSLPRIAWAYDEPLGDAAVVPTFFVTKEAARNVKVVFAGEGSDELFGGYPWHWIFHHGGWFYGSQPLQFFRHAPRINSHVIAKAMSIALPGYSLGQRYLAYQAIFDPEQVARLAPHLREGATKQVFASILDPIGSSPLRRILECDTRTRLPESYLMKADKGSMVNSVEERTPYLDKSLMQFAFGLADKHKVTLTSGKTILRKVARDFLPSSTTGRRKRGYGVPVAGWAIGEVGSYMSGLIEKSELISKVMDARKVVEIMRNRAIRPYQFWSLGSLALWDETFRPGVAERANRRSI